MPTYDSNAKRVYAEIERAQARDALKAVLLYPLANYQRLVDYGELNGSDTVNLEVTVGWLRDVEEALAVLENQPALQ